MKNAILLILLRAIDLSDGEFALLLARCNAAEVRDQLIAIWRSLVSGRSESSG